MAPKQTDPQFKLRLPPDLKDALDSAAQRNNRSVSAEILARLAESFRYEGKEDVWDRKIADLDRQQAELKADLDRLKNRVRD
jgi:hypothetical protein